VPRPALLEAEMGPRRRRRGDPTVYVPGRWIWGLVPQWGHGVTAVETFNAADNPAQRLNEPQWSHGVTTAETSHLRLG
jgi:hypothetical protein